jgi:hypothetical protein
MTAISRVSAVWFDPLFNLVSKPILFFVLPKYDKMMISTVFLNNDIVINIWKLLAFVLFLVMPEISPLLVSLAKTVRLLDLNLSLTCAQRRRYL